MKRTLNICSNFLLVTMDITYNWDQLSYKNDHSYTSRYKENVPDLRCFVVLFCRFVVLPKETPPLHRGQNFACKLSKQ